MLNEEEPVTIELDPFIFALTNDRLELASEREDGRKQRPFILTGQAAAPFLPPLVSAASESPGSGWGITRCRVDSSLKLTGYFVSPLHVGFPSRRPGTCWRITWCRVDSSLKLTGYFMSLLHLGISRPTVRRGSAGSGIGMPS